MIRKVVFLCVLVAITAVVPAMAQGNNLTPLEQQMLQKGLTPQSPTGITGARHYVAPNAVIRERTFGSDPGAQLSLNALRTFMTLASPSCGTTLGSNGGFESGNFSGWNGAGEGGYGGSMTPDLSINTPGPVAYVCNDPLLDYVWAGQYSAQLGDGIPWGSDPSNEPWASTIYQDIVAPPSAQLNFAYAVIAANPGHGYGSDPYFEVKVVDLTASAVVYDALDYTTSFNPATPCLPWCLSCISDPNSGSPIVYRQWTQVTISTNSYAGHTLRVSFRANDCAPSAHFCEVFADGFSVGCPDSIAPAAVSLAATCEKNPAAPTDSSACVKLAWTAPADPTSVCDTTATLCNPTTASAAVYFARWSLSPIVTQADWSAATPISGLPTPAAPGTPETLTFCGLPKHVPLYFAFVSEDGSLNASPMATAAILPGCSDNALDCGAAYLSVTELWPPNHQMVPISVLGVTNEGGGPITFTYHVTQDEAVDATGSGNTCPDAQLVNGVLSVRSERTGSGDGRVYAITVTADDGLGGTCTTAPLTVCVPHDQGRGHRCVDSGQKYDSFAKCVKGKGLSDLQSESGDTPATLALKVGAVHGGSSLIEYSLPQESDILLSVFDITGRHLATIEKGRMTSGVHQTTWNTAGLPGGMYYCRIQAGASSVTRSVLVLK